MPSGDPRNDSGVRSLDEAPKLHKTPALVQGSKDSVAHYISGFVDGEGCFCVSFQPSKRHRFGWEVRPSFSVSQNADRSELLYVIQREWQCGFIRPDRSDNTLKYEVRQVGDMVERVLPHFENYPLRSSKQADVARFDRVCRLVFERSHLVEEGFEEIVRVAMQMNPSGKRKYLGSDILASLRPGERIVYAASNRGRT